MKSLHFKKITKFDNLYVEAKILLIPTNKRTAYEGQIVAGAGDYLFLSREGNIGNLTAYEMYIVTSDAVKLNEWCFEKHNGESHTVNPTIYTDDDKNSWYLRKMNMNCLINDPECKKIIASTNKELGLPKIDKDFLLFYINKHNENIKNDRVLVLYKEEDAEFAGQFNRDAKIVKPEIINGFIEIYMCKDDIKHMNILKINGSGLFNWNSSLSEETKLKMLSWFNSLSITEQQFVKYFINEAKMDEYEANCCDESL